MKIRRHGDVYTILLDIGKTQGDELVFRSWVSYYLIAIFLPNKLAPPNSLTNFSLLEPDKQHASTGDGAFRWGNAPYADRGWSEVGCVEATPKCTAQAASLTPS